MASATNYLAKKILDHVLGVAVYTPPTQLNLSLHLASPTVSGSYANEVTGAGYARINIFGDISAADLTTRRSYNTTVFNIGPATADWGTVTYAAISDESGNMLLFQPLAEAQTISIGGQFQLTPAQFSAAAS